MTGSIRAVSAVTFADAVTLRAPTTVLSDNVRTNGTALTITGNVTIAGNVLIDTSNSFAVGAGADVTIGGTSNADAAANSRNFNIYAGTAGDVAMGGDVGNTQRLAVFTGSGAAVG